MDIARIKLDHITTFWNNFVWNYRIIQNKITWNEEVKINYYGDILSYFNSTFDLLKREPLKSDFQGCVFYSIGLLQIVYVHQDLTDELLRIFKIAKSDLKDKKPNREIRNELIGHPIRRIEGKIKSSIFWRNELTNENLCYIKYDANKNFAGEDQYYKIRDIIDSHQYFLNKYFDKILLKIKVILKKYSKQLKELQDALQKDIDFNRIVILTSQRYEIMFKKNNLYNASTLIQCFKRQNEHARYKYVVDYFKKELTDCLIDTQSYIQKLISDISTEHSNSDIFDIPNCEIVFSKDTDILNVINDKPIDYHFELEKLHGRHPVFGISYFKGLFKNDPEILFELENMELNFYDNLEYYSSFGYIKYLIENKQIKKHCC